MRYEHWGWTIGTGIFIDDIDAIFWREASILLGVSAAVMIGVCLLLLAVSRRIIGTPGGEPAYAAEIMEVIAAGDLSRDIVISGGGGDRDPQRRDPDDTGGARHRRHGQGPARRGVALPAVAGGPGRDRQPSRWRSFLPGRPPW